MGTSLKDLIVDPMKLIPFPPGFGFLFPKKSSSRVLILTSLELRSPPFGALGLGLGSGSSILTGLSWLKISGVFGEGTLIG